MVDTMKDNPELEKALITGIMKISQESMFSGFNNASTADLSDSLAKDKFGFTETEVSELLNYYSLESQENKSAALIQNLIKSLGLGFKGKKCAVRY